MPLAPARTPPALPLLLGLLLLCPLQARAGGTLSAAAYDMPPYIGESLAQGGALAEIVRAAFAREGQKIDLGFYPAIRAQKMAQVGAVDILLPVTKDASLKGDFLLSQPLPGMQLGLLGPKAATHPQGPFQAAGKRIGVVRGAFSNRVLGAYRGARLHPASNNLALLQMLSTGRLDYVLIDKFTAADLMVNRLPQLIGKLGFVSQTVKPIDFHLAFPKKDAQSQARVARFNRGLAAIKADGTLDRILYKHGLLSFKPVQGKKVLHIATVDNPDMVIMRKLSRAYEAAHPHVKLDWRVLDENTLRQRLLGDLAVSSGQYDVMTIGAYETPIWAKKGWLSPFSKLPAGYHPEDLIKPIRAGLSWHHKLYALPFYGESSMTYYRKDLFAQAGLHMPKAPTYDQIKRFADRLNDPQQQIYGICLRGKPGWGQNMGYFSTLVNTFGGAWFDMQWHGQLDTRPWHRALKLYLHLLRDDGPPHPEKKGYTQNLKLFAQGHCALWIDATVAAGTLFDPARSRVAGKVGFADAPVAVTPKGSHWLWSWALAVPVSSRLKPRARQFIEWATSKGYIKQVAKADGWTLVPPGTRYSTYRNPQYQAAAPFSRFVLDAIKSANPDQAGLKPRPYRGIQFVAIPEFPALGNFVGKKLGQALEGKITPAQALKQANDFVNSTAYQTGYQSR